MLALIVVLLLVALLFGLGFAIHLLWIVAVIAMILWALGFLLLPTGGRWWRW